jgi:hypothetical protein
LKHDADNDFTLELPASPGGSGGITALVPNELIADTTGTRWAATLSAEEPLRGGWRLSGYIDYREGVVGDLTPDGITTVGIHVVWTPLAGFRRRSPIDQ